VRRQDECRADRIGDTKEMGVSLASQRPFEALFTPTVILIMDKRYTMPWHVILFAGFPNELQIAMAVFAHAMIDGRYMNVQTKVLTASLEHVQHEHRIRAAAHCSQNGDVPAVRLLKTFFNTPF
jgi:hypothetical protein